MTNALLALSPLDGRYAAKLANLRPILSEFGLIKFRVIVEIRWLQLLLNHGQLAEFSPLSRQANQFLDKIIENFSEKDAARIKQIEEETNHDVKAVEYFLKECIQEIPELSAVNELIHFGCTSEDINNLAYSLMLQSARQQFLLPELEQLLATLKHFAHENAELAMLSRTHGQPATPTTLGKEFANFAARLQRQIEQLKNSPLLGKLNGASGNYNALTVAYPEINWPVLSKKIVTELGLVWNDYTTQIEPHDFIVEFFAILSRINTIFIDFNRDIWGYISLNYFKQNKVAKEVGSSTMPHKINPIDFENAEGNLGIANALLSYMELKLPISRWQRDLSDSTVLRNVGVAIAHTLLAYQSTLKGLKKISPNLEIIAKDLDQHWEILAEPIQTLMRRFGIKQPYEKLKDFTRGKQITREILQEFIEKLELPDEVKKDLRELTPSNYLGYASDLAKEI